MKRDDKVRRGNHVGARLAQHTHELTTNVFYD